MAWSERTELLTPRSIDQLHEVIGSGTLIAGGTDLLVQMRAGRKEKRLIDVSSLSDAPPPVAWRDGAVELSATASISSVVAGLGGRLPGVAASARLFGSLQIRNRATIGGNLANASPAGDLVPPLVAADAVAVVVGRGGSKTVPVADVAAGPGQTNLAAEEWLSIVRVPLPDAEEGFLKLGGRSAMAISIVSLAWRWSRADDGTLAGVRLALGAVTPTVRRAREAEAELEGKHPTDEALQRAVLALKSEITPIDDVRASAWYRTEVAGQLLRQALVG